MVSKEYKNWIKVQAKKNRNSLTNAEFAVKQWLENNGIRHRAQVPIVCSKDGAGYIADFVIYEKPYRRCILEVDGEYHNSEEMRCKDRIRTENLENRGYLVERIENESVCSNDQLDKTMETIISRFKERRNEKRRIHP